MKKLFLVAVTTVGFAAPMFPAFAADAVQPATTTATAVAAPTLAQTLMQAQLDKCLAAGTITMEQIQPMTDDQLVKALDDCSKLASAAAAPQVVAQPTFVPQPVVVSQPAVVSAPVSDFAPAPVRRRQVFTDNSFGGSGGGIFNGSAIDVGGIGNTTTTQTNNFPDIPGGIGGGGAGGGAGNGNPPKNTLDGRIAGLQSGLQEGINTGALTPTEASRIGGQIATIQAMRSTLGNNPNARLLIQQQIDTTTTDFNSSVHNADGIPNPDLFRMLKRKNGAATLAGGDTHSRFAALRERMASLKNGGALSKIPGNTGIAGGIFSKQGNTGIAGGLFPKKVPGNTGIAGGILSKRQGNTGIAGGLFPKKVPGNTGIAGGILSKASSAGSNHLKYAERRAAARAARQGAGVSSVKTSNSRVFSHRAATASNGSAVSRHFKRRFASR
jgi:hypothetical protein